MTLGKSAIPRVWLDQHAYRCWALHKQPSDVGKPLKHNPERTKEGWAMIESRRQGLARMLSSPHCEASSQVE